MNNLCLFNGISKLIESIPPISDILKLRTESLPIKKYLVNYLEKLGSLERTYKEMERLYAEVHKEVARLGGNPHLEALLKIIDLPKDENNNTE